MGLHGQNPLFFSHNIHCSIGWPLGCRTVDLIL